MNDKGISKKELFSPLDVYVSDLDLETPVEKDYYGLTEDQVKQLTEKDQKGTPYCVGYTGSSMLELMNDFEVFSAKYIYGNTDKIYEGSNGGGLVSFNMFKFLFTFGGVLEEHAPDDVPLKSSDYPQYYEDIPNIANTHKKYKIGAYMRVDNSLQAIKQGFENLDVMAVAVRTFKTSRRRVDGDRIRQFRYSEKAEGGHLMMVTRMKVINGKHYVYTLNSWGEGEAVFCLEDFPKTSINFYGGTKSKPIVKKVEQVVVTNKSKYPTFENFTVAELKDITVEMAIDIQGIRDVTKELTELYEGHKKGVSITITSGKRSVAHNKAVGGVSNSEHLTGEAVDIKAVSSAQKSMLLQATYIYYFRKGVKPRIGVSWKSGFIHIGIGANKPKPAIWSY